MALIMLLLIGYIFNHYKQTEILENPLTIIILPYHILFK